MRAKKNSNEMKMEYWAQVSEGDARASRHYGFGAFLFVFMAAHLIAPLITWAQIVSASREVGAATAWALLGYPVGRTMFCFFLVQAISWCVIFGLAIYKSRNFRPVTIGILLARYPAWFILSVASAGSWWPIGDAAALLPVGSTIFWCLYLHKSRRVRATFDRQLRPSEMELRAS
jgi:hypothetical protein